MKKYINSFPGYEHIPGPEHKGLGRNMYRGIDLGFGGYVYSEPGIYTNVALLDAQNMHGASIIALNKLGEYTKTYEELRLVRNLIKGHKMEEVKKLFNGKLTPYLTDEDSADALSNALKLPLNQLYGISFSKYEMPTVDSRDKNNIIALRGALFMKTLQDEVVKKGFKVIHIKTDSIKIPNATDEIIKFVQEFGEKYDYVMEHEATYDRICLVNDSTYIAKYDDKGIRNKGGKKAGQWVAVADQFQVPYVFKTLFSKEPITFEDTCETFSVKEGEIYLDMNESLPDVSEFEKKLKKLEDDYKKGKISDTRFEKEGLRLSEEIAKGHNYVFIGRVGQFCPMMDGADGGVLYRCKDGKYYAVTGTKGYRWLESEVVKALGKEDQIDKSYYIRLVDEAKKAIGEYGDFEMFANADEFLDFMSIPDNKPDGDYELPWDPDPAEKEHPKDG